MDDCGFEFVTKRLFNSSGFQALYLPDFTAGVVRHSTRKTRPALVDYIDNIALLELARWGIVRVSQGDIDDPIEISYDEQAADQRFRLMIGMEADE